MSLPSAAPLVTSVSSSNAGDDIDDLVVSLLTNTIVDDNDDKYRGYEFIDNEDGINSSDDEAIHSDEDTEEEEEDDDNNNNSNNNNNAISTVGIPYEDLINENDSNDDDDDEFIDSIVEDFKYGNNALLDRQLIGLERDYENTIMQTSVIPAHNNNEERVIKDDDIISPLSIGRSTIDPKVYFSNLNYENKNYIATEDFASVSPLDFEKISKIKMCMSKMNITIRPQTDKLIEQIVR